eukprot:TRINITY_DN49793_c0_g1_i1.p1 TRINITY_DN49793_c0_g1~~TRINITY_DN49793_c0_g1_i1.p1  ORF type:complete len:206 (+),score=39.05 TRINITY_DN49793_c0_g1_i1:29-619(+)
MALGRNSSLRSLTIAAWDGRLGGEAGVALAEVLGRRSFSGLRALTIEGDVELVDEAWLALAVAIERSSCLEFVRIDAVPASRESEAWAAVASSLNRTVTLQCVHCRGWEEDGRKAGERNRALRAQGRALAALARWSSDTGYFSLTEKVFRRQVFGYFLPPRCDLLPVDFAVVSGASTDDVSDGLGNSTSPSSLFHA